MAITDKLAGLQPQAGLGGLTGLLSGLQSVGQTRVSERDKRLAEERQKQTDILTGLKQGVDITQLNDPEYLKQASIRGEGGIFDDPKGELAFLLKAKNDSRFNQLPQETQDAVNQGINVKAKDLQTTFNVKEAETRGQLIPKLELEPQITEAKSRATQRATDIDELGNMTSKMPELTKTVDKLRDLGSKATYTLAGRVKDIITREIGLPVGEGAKARTEYISIVNNQVLPLLRDTFGAAFTVQEGESLKATLGNPNVSPEEKEKVLDAFIQQKINDIKSKQRKLGIQEQNTGGVSFEELWGE